MTATPPTYEMTATNALEAINILDAARNLITSHLTLSHPGRSFVPDRETATIPINLSVSVDLTGVLSRINTPAA